MSFDQGEFNFDAKGSEAGYLKWRAPAMGSHAGAPVFILKGLEFTPQEIESIVQVDAD